jgi:hypothetical protein
MFHQMVLSFRITEIKVVAQEIGHHYSQLYTHFSSSRHYVFVYDGK